MLIRVNPAADRPIYVQIADSVRADIAVGQVGPGDPLPPARDVAASLGINVHTVLHAYQLLRDEGIVDLRRRRGAVVTEAAASLTALHRDVLKLVDSAARLGVAPGALASMIADASTPSDGAAAPTAPHSDKTGTE